MGMEYDSSPKDIYVRRIDRASAQYVLVLHSFDTRVVQAVSNYNMQFPGLSVPVHRQSFLTSSLPKQRFFQDFSPLVLMSNQRTLRSKEQIEQ